MEEKGLKEYPRGMPSREMDLFFTLFDVENGLIIFKSSMHVSVSLRQ